MQMFYFVFTQYKLSSRVLRAGLDVISKHNQHYGVLFGYNFIRRNEHSFEQTLRYLKQSGIDVLIDNGAFHILSSKITVDEYLRYVDKYKRFINKMMRYDNATFALPDIPCDERFLSDMTIDRRIEMTVKLHYDIYNSIQNDSLMKVIQGYYPQQYVKCAEKLKDVKTQRVGVGSLCVRKYISENVRRIKEIVKALKDEGQLHTFGLALRLLRHVIDEIFSSDSGAWSYTSQFYKKNKLCEDVYKRNIKVILDYMSKIEKMKMQTLTRWIQ